MATCCCFGAGHLRASATAQPYGLAGKPFFIDVTIDNNSSTSLDFVEVRARLAVESSALAAHRCCRRCRRAAPLSPPQLPTVC